ncbi:MAG TPA: sugar isomerase domain-containing protein [Vicinamibacteria bacterium]
MSAIAYHDAITKVLDEIRRTQIGKIQQAGEAIATSIGSGGLAWLFGSGHSVIPVMDVFPRYGSFVGFVPLYDPRLMWSNVVGPGGARELLWIERKEGYAPVFLQSYALRKGDSFVAFSHGGTNAAPIEAALYAKERGLTVISVSSLANAAAAAATHSSGKRLSDVADIAIDNCVAPEDSQVDVGQEEKVAAGSTMAVVYVAMALVAETGARLAARGHRLTTFVSPNVPGVAAGHNMRVFEAYARRLAERGAP